jgi:hypothetical protein
MVIVTIGSHQSQPHSTLTAQEAPLIAIQPTTRGRMPYLAALAYYSPEIRSESPRLPTPSPLKISIESS